MKYWIVLAFLWTAPLGKLIPVPGTPHSFRFFYLLMAVGIPVLLIGSVSRRLVLFAAAQLPFLSYLLWSAAHTYGPQAAGGAESNPIFRGLLLTVELIFVALAASRCQREPLTVRARLMVIPLFAYLLSMAFGYVFFVGYYSGALSLSLIEPFHVLLQFGYGILRFSPGSYPNEYGIVSSFFASLVLFMLLHWSTVTSALGGPSRATTWLKCLLVLSFPLMLVALFLATTRAAYLAFIASAVAVGMMQRTVVARLRYFGVAALLLLAALVWVQQYFDVLGLLTYAYVGFFDRTASAYQRFIEWREAFEGFESAPWFGTGYGTVDGVHNIYLQVLFGAGVVGALLFAFFFVSLRTARQSLSEVPKSDDPERDEASLRFLRAGCYIAVFHTLWFGCSNHNFNHFLTWFTVLLVLLVPRARPATAEALVRPESVAEGLPSRA